MDVGGLVCLSRPRFVSHAVLLPVTVQRYVKNVFSPRLRGLLLECLRKHTIVFLFFLPLYRPRAGIVQRTTSIPEYASRRRFVLDLHSYACFSMPRFGTALPSATRPAAAALPRHARPTRHKVLPGKVRASTPNSTSEERRKEPPPVPYMAERSWQLSIAPWSTTCYRSDAAYVRISSEKL